MSNSNYSKGRFLIKDRVRRIMVYMSNIIIACFYSFVTFWLIGFITVSDYGNGGYYANVEVQTNSSFAIAFFLLVNLIQFFFFLFLAFKVSNKIIKSNGVDYYYNQMKYFMRLVKVAFVIGIISVMYFFFSSGNIVLGIIGSFVWIVIHTFFYWFFEMTFGKLESYFLVKKKEQQWNHLIEEIKEINGLKNNSDQIPFDDFV